MWRRLKSALRAGEPPITHGGVVAQIWRGGSGRLAQLAKAMRAVEIAALDGELGRHAGMLLARSGLSDAIDSAVVALANNEDQIVTSDPDDIAVLIAATDRRIDVIHT
jgi:hypothetical protein